MRSHLYGLVVFAIISHASVTCAAEFRALGPETVTQYSPNSWYSPVLTVTALSSDGTKIGGHIRETVISYDCARLACEIASFVLNLDGHSTPDWLDTPTPLNFPANPLSGYPFTVAALSHDGSSSLIVSESLHLESAIYRAGQPHLLRPIIDNPDWLVGSDISSDGRVVVGDLGNRPFWWHEASGLQELSDLREDLWFEASAVSGNGQTILLNSRLPSTGPGDIYAIDANRRNAFQWDAVGGLKELLPIPGEAASEAVASSSDGAIVIGNSTTVSTSSRMISLRATRWDDGIAEELDGMSGYSWSASSDVTANGEIVVGRAYNVDLGQLPVPFPFERNESSALSIAVLWNDQGDVYDLKQLLIDQFNLGVYLDSWVLTNARFISDDGNVIVGDGIDPTGRNSLWLARLSVPEPSSTAYLMVVTGMLLWGARSRREHSHRSPK